ncbi:restriction endonuclease subunit S [Acetobacter indonesiensis]|uniref:restriction endonuclease subunit S n=1 Tax=Acetobacter indonesiensis TaxID=104101 RepID=UPI000A36E49F|nr:restriction endonuclease subunit S [Acetobacter indonesiensis]
MSTLPQGWVETTLGEIVNLRSDKVDPTNVPEKPFIGLEAIEPHTSIILRVGQASEVKSTVACFEAGDVLYSRLRPYLNKVTCPDFSGVASAEILALKPSDAAEAEFVRRSIMTRGFLDFTAMLDKGDRPRVNYDEIAAFQLPLPPPPEQRRIVAKIDSLTGKSRRARDHLDHIPRLVEKYKQAILAAAFRSDEDWVRVGDVITDIRYGTAKKCNYDGGAVPVLRIPNVQRGRIDLGDIKSANFDAKELLKLELRTGDILVIRSNGSLDLVGRCAIVDDMAAGMLFAGYLIRLRLDPTRCLPEYLHWFLQSSVARNAITNAAKSTSGVNNLNAQELQALELPLPSIAMQMERIASVETAFTWIDRLAADTNSARKLVDHLDQGVFAKAFKGELVPQDPTDEPASALLERIRAERAAAPKAKRGRRKVA